MKVPKGSEKYFILLKISYLKDILLFNGIGKLINLVEALRLSDIICNNYKLKFYIFKHG